MLVLKNISKDYSIAKNPFRALNDINVSFPNSQFVTILGPSGCGKTTLLNIIGGLDQYSEGDLIIQGKSTQDFKMQDWDAYRNHHVGFVFQNYNLISHLTILENVEISLRLTGIEPKERKERATNALREMGIESELHKKPNQLSGGQLQRVAIARALVNDPSVILADEPTGALDSKTSDQVISILKEVSKTRLVIMVTHNEEIAARFSDRVIKMRDGHIISDSAEEMSINQEVKGKDYQINKTAMSLGTALISSFKNLLTKKGRTILTSIAGSLGIIGIGLVAAVSNGFQSYVDRVERNTMANYPVAVFAQSIDYSTAFNAPKTNYTPYPDGEELIVYDRNETNEQAITVNNNLITNEFLSFVDDLKEEGLVASSMVNYPSDIHVVVKPPTKDPRFLVSPSYNNFTPLPSGLFTQLPGNEEYMLEFYDLLGKDSHFPTNKNEIMLVVDKYSRLSIQDLVNIGIVNDVNQATTLKAIPFDDLLGKEYKMFTRDDYYYKVPDNADDFEMIDFRGQVRTMERFRTRSANSIYNDSAIGETLKISGILRAKPNIQIELITMGLVYTQELNEYMFNINKGNRAARAQVNNIVFNEPPNENNLAQAISFYPIISNSVNKEESRILADNYLRRLKSLGASHDDISPDDPIYEAFLDDFLEATYSPVESVALFAKDSASKILIKERIEEYNKGKEAKFKIVPFDAVQLVTETLGTLINVITIVLVVFTSISLVVSGLLIGIITYISVIERTKEIGIMRAIGARKKDISRLFNAETLMIGVFAGVIGIVLTYLLSIPINIIVNHLLPAQNIGQIALFAPWAAGILLIFNVILTVVSGLIPSRFAANKNPVEALRTE